MITIKKRELIIPVEDRTIGTDYDLGVENKLFLLPIVNESGTDISHLEYTLDLKYRDLVYNSVMLEKEIYEEHFILVWTVDKQSLTEPGTIFASLRAIDQFGTLKWASNRGAFYVLDSVNTPGGYTGDITEFEQLEARLKEYRDETNALKTQTEQVLADTQLVKQETEAVLAQAKQDIVELDARIEQVEQDIANATTTMEQAIEAAKEIEQTIATVNGLLTQCQQQVALATAQAQAAEEQVGLAQQQVALAGLQVSLAADEADRAEAAVEEARNVVKNFSNDNLLINPDGAINQRGLNEYETDVHYLYGLDMWSFAYGRMSSNDGVITITNTDSVNRSTCRQPMTTLKSGDTVTASLLINGIYHEATYTIPDGNFVTTIIGREDEDYSVVIYRTPVTEIRFALIVDNQKTVNFAEIKLEHGIIATPYTPPDQSLELAKCQRYMTKIGRGTRWKCARYDSNNIWFTIPLPVPMRTSGGTLVNTDKLEIASASQGASVATGFTYVNEYYGGDSAIMTLKATKSGHGIVEPVLFIKYDEDTFFIDNNIY